MRKLRSLKSAAAMVLTIAAQVLPAYGRELCKCAKKPPNWSGGVSLT
jgi:hypothetical protein